MGELVALRFFEEVGRRWGEMGGRSAKYGKRMDWKRSSYWSAGTPGFAGVQPHAGRSRYL